MILTMRLFTQRDIYYVEINGKRRSLRTKDKTVARRLHNQIKREYLKGKVHQLIGKCTVTLGQYRDEFLKWAEDVQPTKTFKANRLALNKLVHYTGETISLEQISQKHLDQMIADCKRRALAVASINNYIRHARASLNKAVDWKYIRSNPLSGAKEFPLEKRPPGFLSRQEALRFLASIEDVDLRRFAAALIATGRRRSELFRLRWEDVDLEGNRYLARKTKNHLSKWYPINAMFKSILLIIGPKKNCRVFDRWLHPDTITHLIKQVLRDAGYGHLKTHSLRHTFASLKAVEGRSLKEIQELLGHTEIKTTQIYAHLTEDHLAEVAEINLGPIDLGK
ncbi:MAG: site-specific integrase [Desulfobacterales bacterium]|nr:site-specific integrase [Desulfobacterales bacterium]